MAANILRYGAPAVFRTNLFQKQHSLVKNCMFSPEFRFFHLSSPWNSVVSFNLSDIGEGIREVSVKEWYVKVGDTVQQFDNLCEVQSDKASVTITSRYDGKITKIHHNVNEIALVGHPLLDFEVEDEEAETTEAAAPQTTVEDNSKPSQTSNISSCTEIEKARSITLATPAVRRIAMENKVDLSKVPPTGRNGRVLKGDVLEYLGHVPAGTNIPHPTIAAKAAAAANLTSAIVPADRTERIESGVRKAMIKGMTAALQIPHFAYSDEIDMTKLIDFRGQLQMVAKDMGLTKLTFMPFFIKAASIALSQYPILNSSLDLQNESIIYKGAHNISVAIDTPQGLVVPNVKNCQLKNIIQIATDLNILVEKGRLGKLAPDDFSNGTFSLSNIGVVGGTYTHPCIMAPQVAIGAMGRTKVVPRFDDDDKIVKAHIMNISWCADHRVIDGVTMASFSNIWKKHVENPALFLLS